MLGLPTETDDDVAGIADLAQKVVDAYYANPDKPKGKSVTVSVSASTFIPKPFTPFQWDAQDDTETILRKQTLLRESVHTRKVNLSFHLPETSLLEAVFARGDRRLADVLECAWRKGCRFDGWDDQFRFDLWQQAFDECGLSPAFYANRKRSYDEVLPWAHMDYGVSMRYLQRESEKARESVTTPHCRQRCGGCGADKMNGGKCDARCTVVD